MTLRAVRSTAFAMLLTLAFWRPAHSGDNIERGRYLVEDVAYCPVCHTPRTPEGELDESRWLEGGPHGYQPVHDTPAWIDTAPGLAGLPGGYSSEDLVRFLQTGVTRTGRKPRPPMKIFRLGREDAEAVAAYLESLGRD